MTETNDITREWLREVIHLSGLKPTPFAKKAGLSPSTILRAIEDGSTTEIETRTIQKIMEAFDVHGPGVLQSKPQKLQAFIERDLDEHFLETPKFAGLPLTQSQYVKRVSSRALELIGFVPGDLVLFDRIAHPGPGDPVEAQVFLPGLSKPETIFRAFEAPYLITRTTDLSLPSRPEYVDGSRVCIVAVAVRCLRERFVLTP